MSRCKRCDSRRMKNWLKFWNAYNSTGTNTTYSCLASISPTSTNSNLWNLSHSWQQRLSYWITTSKTTIAFHSCESGFLLLVLSIFIIQLIPHNRTFHQNSCSFPWPRSKYLYWLANPVVFNYSVYTSNVNFEHLSFPAIIVSYLLATSFSTLHPCIKISFRHTPTSLATVSPDVSVLYKTDDTAANSHHDSVYFKSLNSTWSVTRPNLLEKLSGVLGQCKWKLETQSYVSFWFALTNGYLCLHQHFQHLNNKAETGASFRKKLNSRSSVLDNCISLTLFALPQLEVEMEHFSYLQ
jgi:hypothetical protein